MNVILFLKANDPLSDHLDHLVNELDGGDDRMIICRTVKSLELHLRSARACPDIVLLSAPDKETLEELIGIHNLLRYTRVVEIVADHSTDAIKLAHRLHPRYVHNQRDGLGDLLSVLNNILRVEA